MSEFTQCNYCGLKGIRARAKKSGMKVTTIPGWRGGTDVFVHPSDVKIEKGAGEEDHSHHKYFRSWMMEIGEKCVC